MNNKEEAGKIFDTYYSLLKDCNESDVITNLNKHIKSSQYPPTINNLVARLTNEPYIPNFVETKNKLALQDSERRLAIESRGFNVDSEQIQRAKEKALQDIANAIERSNRKNDWEVE